MNVPEQQKALELLCEALPYIDPDDPALSSYGKRKTRGLETRIRNFLDKYLEED